jgi:hypothetical protein
MKGCRAARWYVFKQKIPIWVNLGGPYIEKCGYIFWSFGIFYGHLEYCMAIWNILWPFGIYYIWSFGIFYGHLV